MKEKIAAIMLFAIVMIAVFAILITPEKSKAFSGNIKRFNSYDELVSFVKNNTMEKMIMIYDAKTIDANQRLQKKDFSKTNVQVEGIDEADIVKTDGEYIYKVTTKNEGDNIFIIKADKLKIYSCIEVDYSIKGIFVNEDKLVIIGVYEWYSLIKGGEYYSPKTILQLYNISD
ncbi:MAG: beta-propeller domain-containing protein, partial [Candidatus Thermoplasmatota archaeon]